MDEDQQFCLRWNNHQSTLISVFDTLLEKETLVDCTLAAEGQFLRAHKVVLSACSPYFAALLSQQYDKHPIFILKDVKFQELRAMMDYMYRGEVNISQDQLAALLKAAESLQIKGLSDSSGGRSGNNGTQSGHAKDTSAANKNASSKGSGLTIEQKMPRLAASASEIDADMSEAHEGSASPNARKRKKVRRRSIETNNVDNHDHHSNSSSHSMPHGGAAATQQQAQAPQQATSTMPTTLTSATSSANVLSVTKKTDQEMKSDGDEHDDLPRPAKEVPQRQNNGGRKSISSAAPTAKTTTGSVTHKDGQQDLIEPKNEYDESNEETVEDLTLDEEEMMEEMEQAGPSHGGEGSSQGYPQWPVDRSQDNEAFIASQDATGHHRDAQGEEELTCTPMIYMGENGRNRSPYGDMDNGQDNGQRFFCTVCDKSYLRKRHLQRHMRDECVGIPPRFQCSMCTSKFRRKYHLVRHLNSKHAVIVTKENELDMIQSKSNKSKRMKLEDHLDDEYLMKQEKLFTENNFLNNEIFSRAMNMIMPKTVDGDPKAMPIIDTNQLLQSMKQQQQSFLTNGMAGMAAMLPSMPAISDDPEYYSRLMNLKEMAVNAMSKGGYDMETDCDSADDAQDLSVAPRGNGRSIAADSDDTDRDTKGRHTPNVVDDFHMKMNIELRPDFLGSRLCGDANQKSQIIPNDTLN